MDVGSLLALAAPLALLAVALAVVSSGSAVQDSWLALAAGREVAEHGLPSADHLTLLASGHHWVDQQWLAQLFLYGAARAGGVGFAFAICIFAIVCAFGLAAFVAYRRGASPVLLLVFLVWAVVSAPWGLQYRPQALALPLFSLVLWLLVRDPHAERRSTLLVLPVLCLWANVHGSVVVGVLLVLAYGVRTGTWAYLMAPATLLASPYASELPGYYRTMLIDPPFGRYIVEWQRTAPEPRTAAFYVLAAAAVVLVAARRRRLTVFDGVVLALMLAIALDAVRGLIWFALAALALLPALATRRPGTMRLEGRAATVCVAVAAATIGGALLFASVRPAHAYETRVPSAALDVVGAHAAAGESVFASEGAADWLLWRLPSLRGRIAYDVRFELLNRPQIQRLFAWRTFAPGWQNVVSGYGVVVDDATHVSRLVATGRWRRVLADSRYAVAERIHRVG